MQKLLLIAGDFPVKSYKEIRDSLKTGDLFAFQGKSASDWMIQMAEGAPYSHVGMVYRDGDKLYFWDAPGAGRNFPDPITGTTHSGCRVAPLDKLSAATGEEGILDYYMSVEVDLFVRQLAAPLERKQLAALEIFFHRASGAPFPGRDVRLPAQFGPAAGLTLSYLLGLGLNLTLAGTFFCAQLIAETYMRMGLLPIAPYPANAYNPANFMSSSPEQLPLIAPHRLTGVVRVSYDAAAPRRPARGGE